MTEAYPPLIDTRNFQSNY